MDLLEKVLKTIRRYSMLTEGDVVLIGLSGGADSVCLTVVLDGLKEEFKLDLCAVYIDHGLRPGETERERVFCRKLCDGLAIRFLERSPDVRKYAGETGLSIQEAARELRYRTYEELSSEIQASKIATGHTADDQAETVLMRLFRGAGRRGLSGIPHVRGKIIRPLLDIRREDIERFLSERQTTFMTDSSNLKTEYVRNRLRQEVIPALKKYNPSVMESINRAADIFREEEKYLERETTRTMMRLITRKTENSIELFLVPLLTVDRAILRRILKRALNEIGADRGIELIHIDDIIGLVRENRSGDMIHLPGEIRAVKSYATLRLTRETSFGLQSRYITVPGETAINEKGLSIISQLLDNKEEITNRNTALFDLQSLVLPLQIRQRRKGDFFYPAGFGRRKKLQDFFVDEKVPREERDSVPLVVSGEDIIWVAGYRADERFQVTDRTERCLKLIIWRK